MLRPFTGLIKGLITCVIMTGVHVHSLLNIIDLRSDGLIRTKLVDSAFFDLQEKTCPLDQPYIR
jgi:hypothetical protein